MYQFGRWFNRTRRQEGFDTDGRAADREPPDIEDQLVRAPTALLGPAVRLATIGAVVITVLVVLALLINLGLI